MTMEKNAFSLVGNKLKTMYIQIPKWMRVGI